MKSPWSSNQSEAGPGAESRGGAAATTAPPSGDSDFVDRAAHVLRGVELAAFRGGFEAKAQFAAKPLAKLGRLELWPDGLEGVQILEPAFDPEQAPVAAVVEDPGRRPANPDQMPLQPTSDVLDGRRLATVGKFERPLENDQTHLA